MGRGHSFPRDWHECLLMYRNTVIFTPVLLDTTISHLKATILSRKWKLKPWINTILQNSASKLRYKILWNLVISPWAAQGRRKRLCLSLQDLLMHPLQDLLMHPLPSALSRAGEMKDAGVYSVHRPHDELRALQTIKKSHCLAEDFCLNGDFILKARESISNICRYFGWRTSRGIQPAPWPLFSSTTKPIFVLSPISSHSCWTPH